MCNAQYFSPETYVLNNIRFSQTNSNNGINDALRNKKGLDDNGVMKSLEEINVDSLSIEDKINFHLARAANYCKTEKVHDAMDNVLIATQLAQNNNYTKQYDLSILLKTTIQYKLGQYKDIDTLSAKIVVDNRAFFQIQYLIAHSFFKLEEYGKCKAYCLKLLHTEEISKYDKIQGLNLYAFAAQKTGDYELALNTAYTVDSLFLIVRKSNYYSIINPRLYYNTINSQNYQQKIFPELFQNKNTIAFLLARKKEFQSAESFLSKSIKIAKDNKQTTSEVELEKNIGIINTLSKQYENAEDHYQAALKICFGKENVDLRAEILGIRAKNYYRLKNVLKAREQCNASIDLATKNNNFAQVAQSYAILAQISSFMSDPQKASYYSNLSNENLEKDKTEKIKSDEQDLAFVLKQAALIEIFAEENSELEKVQYKLETTQKEQIKEISKRDDELKESNFLAQKLAIEKAQQDVLILKRELDGLSQQRELEQIKKDRAINILENKNYQVKIRLLKKQSLLDKKIKEQKEKDVLIAKNREKTLRISLIISLSIIGLIVFLLYRNVKNSRAIKAANIKLSTLTENLKTTNLALESTIQDVNNKNEIIELKNYQILESITYAKRIQEASLPKSDEIDLLSKENFVFYKPKDIISGDFYMVSALKNDTNSNLSLFIVGDCTGHGVPGAMLSLLCSSLVRQSITELNVIKPSVLLNEVTMKLKNFFRTTEGSVFNDGMDIACCVIDRSNNKLYFSGAGRPLIHIRNNESTELKGEKHHIGFTNTIFKFTDQEVDVLANDTIYMFSDGFTDQFNGTTRKRFMTKNLINLLTSFQSEDMKTQGQLMESAFEEWKGEFMQMDDVCVLGIKI